MHFLHLLFYDERVRKILFLICSLFLVLAFWQPASAQVTCRLTTSPATVTTNTRTVDLTIVAPGLVPGDNYWVKLDNVVISLGSPQSFQVINGAITVSNLNEQGFLNPPDTNQRLFQAKTYIVTVQAPSVGGTSFCQMSFIVQQAPTGGSGCSLEFTNTSFTPNDDIIIKTRNLSGNPGDRHRVVLKRNNENGSWVSGGCETVDALTNSGVNLGRRETGNYYIEVRDSCRVGELGENKACFSYFTVVPPGTTTGGGVTQTGGSTAPTPIPVCEQKGTSANPFYECRTAIGPINTDPAGFVKSIFGIILGLAGGIALLLIIFSGYRLMTSQGNPEKVQGAKETLTSAIVGLLFIIFSLIILQIIGVEILKIPGFQ